MSIIDDWKQECHKANYRVDVTSLLRWSENIDQFGKLFSCTDRVMHTASSCIERKVLTLDEKNKTVLRKALWAKLFEYFEFSVVDLTCEDDEDGMDDVSKGKRPMKRVRFT